MNASDAGSLSHVRADGTAHMVDVSAKAETSRQATAQAVLHTRPDVLAMIVDGDLPKGDALAVARVAGIMGAKRTPDLIPLCHPLPIAKVTIDFEPDAAAGTMRILATVATRGVTGVEMEALTAAGVAALTLYDMTKAVDKHAVISGIQVLAKSGGKSGDWTARPVDGSGTANSQRVGENIGTGVTEGNPGGATTPGPPITREPGRGTAHE